MASGSVITKEMRSVAPFISFPRFVSETLSEGVRRREGGGECPMPIDFDDDSMQSSTQVGREDAGRVRWFAWGGAWRRPRSAQIDQCRT